MSYHCQTPQYACSIGMSNSELNERCDQLALQQYRPVQVVSYADTGATRYAAIWSHDLRSSLSKVYMSLSAASYQATFDALKEQGYKLLCVSGAASGESQYSGAWEDGGWNGFNARHGLSASGYQAEFDKLTEEGYNLVWVSGHSTGSASSYTGIWSKFADPKRHARHNLPIEDYQDVFDAFKASGYRIAHFNAHCVGSQTLVAAIWVQADGYDPSARH